MRLSITFAIVSFGVAYGEAPKGKRSFQEIIDSYTFIDDLTRKEPERNNSSIKFWKYNFKPTNPIIAIEEDLGAADLVPATPGYSRAIEHLNRGRLEYQKGNYELAKSLWLTGKAKFGKEFEYHRRVDFFVGLAFTQIAHALEKGEQKPWTASEIRLTYANASTFLSLALIRKRDIADPLIEQYTPKVIYNLAAIYYRFERFAAAHAAALEGLNFLRKTGRSDYQPELHRLLAELWIKNQDYLKAVQELDTSIRQNPDPHWAAAAFARIGDIYYDLNNYELAEYSYGLNDEVLQTQSSLSPLSSILRGESLFWLGKFPQAQRYLWFGADMLARTEQDSERYASYAPWAHLRLADSYFAQYAADPKKWHKLKEKAIRAYFQVIHHFPKSEAAQIAKLRKTCFELNSAQGENIKHAKELLNEMKSTVIEQSERELAYACSLTLKTKNDLTADMIEQVREFAEEFPNSRFMPHFIEPVKQSRRTIIDQYLLDGQLFQAIEFYETYKDSLFKNLNETQKQGLFRAYVLAYRTEKAAPFFMDFMKKSANQSPDQALLTLIYLNEDKSLSKETKKNERILADYLLKTPVNLVKTPENLVLLSRFLAQADLKIHLPWLFKLQKSWSQPIAIHACEGIYSLLSQATEHEMNKEVKNILNEIFPEIFPEILDKDSSCASSYLNLEQKVYLGKEKAYGQKWLDRTTWPVKPFLLSYYWSAAEYLAINTENDGARKLWEYIIKNGASDALETKMSKIRLENKPLDYQDLWHNQ